MLKNYLKVAWRSLLRQKAYSFINVFGLAVGLACCILIFLFVQHEWSYDVFHQNAGTIFRVIQDEKSSAGECRLSAYQPLPLAPALQEEFPAILSAVRFIPSSNVIVKHGDASFSENVLFADSPMFERFTFPLLQGDPATALQNPNAIVLTEKMAQKYFSYAEPLGQCLALNFGNRAVLAIFIACLGLFGLATLTAARRIKEIGIRKVLGASVAGIAGLLSKDFIKLVLLANLVAWPVAWYAMNKWLQNFAYRIPLERDWWMFVLAGGLALLVALLTVSTQGIKAALANPVDSLRYE